MESALKNNSLFEAYRSLFDFNYNPCFALDLNGNFNLFNDAAVKLTGYSKDEALQMSFWSILTTESLGKGFEIIRKLIKGNQKEFYACMINKNGQKKDLIVTLIPIERGKKVSGFVGIAKDITKRKKIEPFISGQDKVLEMIAKGFPFIAVLDQINYLIEELSNGRTCSILLVDESQTKFNVGSAPNLPLEYRNLLNGMPIDQASSSYGRALRDKSLVIVSDIANNPFVSGYMGKALEHGLRSCWSAPVFDNQEEVLAVISIYYSKPNLANESDKWMIEKAVSLTSLAIQHYYAQEKINFMSLHDELTGLPNKRLFDEKVNLAIKLYKKDLGKMFGVLYFDLDRFKQINDSLGQSIGDMLLIEVAQRLQDCMREKDTVFRWGGDEFVILLDDVSKNELSFLAGKILEALKAPFFLNDHDIYITPGIGISLFPSDGDNVDELLRKADAAMYQAKKEGRNNYQFFNPAIDQETHKKLEIENHLRKALVKKEFTLHYQPIIDLSTNKISAVESLIRWKQPELGNIPPDQFIPIAEETGMILSIGEWVLKTACTQMKRWQESGLPLPGISVNISFRQFYQPDLVTIIDRVIKETGIDSSCLTIEITESMTMDVEAATGILYNLKNLGVNISIDDFGTGYSSFSYLKKFPIDYLKIDKTFIRDIAKSKDDENIATSILLMAQKLGLNVIAEGVETKEQLGILRENQCNNAQGYFFSKPLSAGDLNGLLSSFH